MPGIVGLITRMPRREAEQELHRMVESLRHESFYRSGTWVDEQLGVYIGWMIRKDSFSDGLPLANAQGDVTMFFSGEEYSEFGTAGRCLDGRCRGLSYLIDRYEMDAEFPKCLNGRFQGIVVDKKSSTVQLFNDRFGMERVNYHEAKQAFYFAAEAKAILAVRPELRQIDPQGLGELISCGCVLEDRTVFQDVKVLPPASCWSFCNAKLEHRDSYFHPREWEEQEALDCESYYQELRKVFSRSLPRYFKSPEPIGMSLTGGLDTRMIMAWHKAAPGSLPCYSFGGSYRECQDVALARRVAGVCSQPYQVIDVGQDFLSQFAHYAERTIYLTDGCAGIGRASDLYANERAAAIAPVRMTGNYGSEILRRLPAFRPANPSAGLFQAELVARTDAARQTYNALLNRHAMSFIAFCQMPWHHYGLLALEQTQLALRSPYLDNELVRTAFRAPGAKAVKTDIFEDSGDCVRLIADGDPELGKIRTDRGFCGTPGLSTTLTRGLLELSFKAEYAYDYGMPQWVARTDHMLSMLHLERLFLGRHKFNHFRVWYRDTLSSYIREILLDPRTLSRPYLNGGMVATMVNRHVRGTGNYTTQIHQMLTLELLHRLFIDSR